MVVHSEKQKRFSRSSAWNGRINRSFNGYIELLTVFRTRRRSREQSSRVPTRTHRVLVTATPTRVAVDETAVKINHKWYCSHLAIETETKLLLDILVSDQHGIDPAAAYLSGLAEKHDRSDTVFLVDGYGYRTSLFRIGLSGQLDYTDRNLIEKWFHTLKQWIDRFHTSWVGSRPSVQRWLEQFVHYYTHQRPHQSLDNRTPVEAELN